MNTKLFVLLGSVGAVHLVAGGLFLAGGCAQEDPPMPPGIYVPRQSVEKNTPAKEPATSGEAAYPATDLDGNKPMTEPAQQAPEKPVEPAKAEAQQPAKDKEHGEKVYIVAKNDSLWLLARKNGLTIEELASYNNLPANAKLKVGQKLYIPAAGSKAVKEKSAKAAHPKAKTSAKPAAKKGGKAPARKTAVQGKRGKDLPADGIYTVKAGDNFSKIAKRHGLKVSDLMAANPGVDSSRLKIGQKLRLTKDAAQIPAAGKSVSAKKNAAAGKPAPAAESTGSADSADQNSQKTSVKSNDIDNLLKDIDDDKTEQASPSASDEAVKAVVSDRNAGIQEKDKLETTANGSNEVVIGEDTTLTAFCKKYRISEKDVRELNRSIPEDGKLKASSRIRMPD